MKITKNMKAGYQGKHDSMRAMAKKLLNHPGEAKDVQYSKSCADKSKMRPYKEGGHVKEHEMKMEPMKKGGSMKMDKEMKMAKNGSMKKGKDCMEPMKKGAPMRMAEGGSMNMPKGNSMGMNSDSMGMPKGTYMNMPEGTYMGMNMAKGGYMNMAKGGSMNMKKDCMEPMKKGGSMKKNKDCGSPQKFAAGGVAKIRHGVASMDGKPMANSVGKQVTKGPKKDSCKKGM